MVHDREEGWFSVFSAYFDASGQEEQSGMLRFLTVGGFIAPVSVWIDVETRWMEALKSKRDTEKVPHGSLR